MKIMTFTYFCMLALCSGLLKANEEIIFLKKEEVVIATSEKGDSGRRLRVHLYYKHKSYDLLLWSKERGVLPDGYVKGPYDNINILGYAVIKKSLYVVYTDSKFILIDKFNDFGGFWQPVDTEIIYHGYLPLFLSPPKAEISLNDNGNIEVKLIETGTIPTHPRKEVKFILDYEKKFILKSEKSESITPPPATWEKEETKENPFWP